MMSPRAPWVELRDVVHIGDEIWAYGYPRVSTAPMTRLCSGTGGRRGLPGPVLLHKLAPGPGAAGG